MRTLNQDIHELNAYELAELAQLPDGGCPASTGSNGGRWLTLIRDMTAEFIEGGQEYATSPQEIAEASIPVYNNRIMSVYVELSLYYEEPDVENIPGLTGVRFAQEALSMAGSRLVEKLIHIYGS